MVGEKHIIIINFSLYCLALTFYDIYNQEKK